jgi:hypothetical protein
MSSGLRSILVGGRRSAMVLNKQREALYRGKMTQQVFKKIMMSQKFFVDLIKMRAVCSCVWIAGVTSRTGRTYAYATMKGASDILEIHSNRLRRNKNEVLILDGGTGEEL